MSRRQRNVTIGVVALLLVGLEVAYQASRGRVACVLIINGCAEPLEDLRVACGPSAAAVRLIRPGESAKVYLAGGGKQTIVLKYRQKGNALQGFEVAGFDLAEMDRDRMRLVIHVRPNEYERYQEEDDPSLLKRMAASSLRWLEKSLESP